MVPPLCLSMDDVDLVAESLDRAFAQAGAGVAAVRSCREISSG
jgi:hypothetical protein